MLEDKDVLHVASLARLTLKEDEIEIYKRELNAIWNDVSKINNMKIDKEDILISPTINQNMTRDDECDDMITINELKVNAPKTSGNFIETEKALHD